MHKTGGVVNMLFGLALLLGMEVCGQQLSYTGTNTYNISSPTHIDAHSIPSLERTPTGLAYGDSGNKLYMVGTAGDFVVQFALSTAYDISSMAASPEAYYRVNSEETNPEDVVFNDTGSKMYILGGSGDDVTEYDLSTNWDVSTAGSPVVFDARAAIETYEGTTPEGDRLTGMRFNDDGSKLFLVCRRTDKIFEFSLTTNYDITTSGTVDAEINLSGIENNPRSIAFNDDGMEIYVIGNQGDDINTFPLSMAYDLSSAGTVSTSVSLPEDAIPQALLINDDGTKFYVAGSTDDEINEYTLSSAYDFSSTITQVAVYIPQAIEINPRDLVFNDDGTKLFVAGDQLNMVVELALSTAYDISTASYSASLFVNAEESNIRGLTFNSSGTVLYIIGNQNDEINVYTLGAAYDLSSSITHSGPFSVATQDTTPNGIYFSNDGTKLFVSGNQGNDINQYTLSPAYDLSSLTADHDGSLDISGLDLAPQSITFNDDGSKFFFLGNDNNSVFEYTLSNNFDLLSGTVTNTASFSVTTEETSPNGITFNADGTKLYISGNNGDDMNQYQTKGNLPETTDNDGTIDNTIPLVITLTGDTFADADADDLLDETTEFTIANVPDGLTPVLTLSGGDTVATLSFTGTADSHLNSDDVANLVFTFTDDAFTTSDATDVLRAVGHTNVMGLDFSECPQDIVYNGSWSGGSGPGGAPDETDDALGISIQADVTLTAKADGACLNVASGQTLSVDDSVELTVVGSLELIGDLRLLGSAQLLQTHTGKKNASGTGDLYKDRMGTLSNVYQIGYWTAPVTTDGSTYTISGVLKDGTTALTTSNTPPNITFTDDLDGNTTSPITLSRRWLASFVDSGSWNEEIDETTELLNPGEGFTKKSTGAVSGQNYTFVGRPNDGDYTHTISAYGSGTWSLLGNPYPSPIDADAFIADNATTANSIVGTLYFYESGNDTSHTTSEYLGGYATRTSGIGAPAPELGMGGKTPGQYIGIGQGFFVEASSGGGTITFNNALRVFDTSDTNTEYFGRGTNTAAFPVLRLGFEFELDGETYHRQLVTGFRGLTNDYDNGYEAEMWDYKSSDLALKVNNRTAPFVITGIDDFSTSLEIPLKLQLDEERTVSFMVDEAIDIPTNIYLKDAVTHFYYDITSVSQEITMPAGNYEDRFFITFTNGSLSTEEALLGSLISLYSQQEQLIVKGTNLIIDTVEIYSLLGQNLHQFYNSEQVPEILLSTKGFRSGVYIIRITTSKGTLAKKVIIL